MSSFASVPNGPPVYRPTVGGAASTEVGVGTDFMDNAIESEAELARLAPILDAIIAGTAQEMTAATPNRPDLPGATILTDSKAERLTLKFFDLLSQGTEFISQNSLNAVANGEGKPAEMSDKEWKRVMWVARHWQANPEKFTEVDVASRLQPGEPAYGYRDGHITREDLEASRQNRKAASDPAADVDNAAPSLPGVSPPAP